MNVFDLGLPPAVRRAFHRSGALLLTVLMVLTGLSLSAGAAWADAASGSAYRTAVVGTPAPSVEPCTSTDPVVCRIREMSPAERAEARDVRIRYHQLLDQMEQTAAEMRAYGSGDEEIGRRMVDMRNEAKDITRAGMSEEAVAALEARNMEKYGNALGPTADQQYARYGSWAKVIDAATRSNAAIDRELGLEPRH
ncbi:hypothetical protein [Streptomyces sp. ISL-100]|uniref:hypothetical protein n=1 Tax=Streptomyces sp. ISL-100 TaxID=2819173 RepID=UPI0020360B36|nr:hypothetical protein [Streptomyces sp. ISL-100]